MSSSRNAPRVGGVSSETRADSRVPDATVARLATYLRVLGSIGDRAITTVSSEELAAAAGVNSAKLRKDLSFLGSYGIRGVGYHVATLTEEIARTLGITVHRSVALIGVGNLGQALAGYAGFASRGFRIAALIDADPSRIGTTIRGLVVRDIADLDEIVAEQQIAIAVLSTPVSAAQDVCDRLVAAGVTSILNFAPVVLSVPDHVDVRKVDLAAELQILSFHETRKAAAARVRGGELPMSVLVVGLSHRTAPVALLECAAVPADDLAKTLDELHRAETISEVLLLSTCNRIEVYADVARFHPAVAEISTVLARHAGLPVTDLAEHLYVHFAEAAAEHLFSVTSGLDSMVVGESQILGQVRAAYAQGTDAGSVGSVLHELAQTALRVGKRVHSDTGIDQAGASIVSVALDQASAVLDGLDGARVVIVGAGSMGALAGSTLRRRAADLDIVVANRGVERASRLAATLGARAIGLSELPEAIADADLLISSTGATGLVIETTAIGDRSDRPLVVLDIALPRDVDPAVATQPGVTYIDLDTLRSSGAAVSDEQVDAASAIVADELGRYLADQQQLAVAPTVTALRARANQVIDAELARLYARLPDADEQTRAEVADAVRRAVEKLLHAPTVRVKELAAQPNGDQYANALRELFDLDPAAAESVAAVKQSGEHRP